ncbi:MAG: DUF1015 domain-containing protein [Schleiferiaceae bacterium]|nr:DUF1015 domain-containing protein [Schleiferiaceae bacterium]
MIELKPFAAIRPTRDKASLVPSRSYVSYSSNDLKDKLNNNPYTFLHVINPDYQRKVALKGSKKFEAVKQAFAGFCERGIFLKDEAPCFYIYQQQTPNTTFTGIIAGVSVADYKAGKIKKHEKTLTQREKMFKHYLSVTGFNAEPVLLTHTPSELLTTLYQYYLSQRAEYEFATTNEHVHKLWLVDNPEHIQQVQQVFAAMNAVYIADGHHRSASSALLGAECISPDSPEAHFMAYLIPEDEIEIFEFNRLIAANPAYDPKAIITQLKQHGKLRGIKGKQYKPTEKGTFSVYMDGKWYAFTPNNNYLDVNHPVKTLDPYVLSVSVLETVFDIKDPRKDPRIAYLPGEVGPEGLKAAVDSGKFVAGFGLCPLHINEIKAVADANLAMPPKSTYINPKLRSGLVIYEFGKEQYVANTK